MLKRKGGRKARVQVVTSLAVVLGSEETYPDGERRGGRNLPWQRKKMKSQGKVLEAVRKGQKMSQLFRVSFTTQETLKS